MSNLLVELLNEASPEVLAQVRDNECKHYLFAQLDWQFIQAHADWEWHYVWLSGKSYITPEIVAAHPELPWDVDQLLSNPSFTWEDIHELAHLGLIDGHELKNQRSISMNPNITRAIMNEYPEYYWDIECLLWHLDITWAEIVAKGWKDVGAEFTENKYCTWEIIINNPQIFYDYLLNFMENNPNCTPELVRQNSMVRWDWLLLVQNSSFTWSEFWQLFRWRFPDDQDYIDYHDAQNDTDRQFPTQSTCEAYFRARYLGNANLTRADIAHLNPSDILLNNAYRFIYRNKFDADRYNLRHRTATRLASWWRMVRRHYLPARQQTQLDRYHELLYAPETGKLYAQAAADFESARSRQK